MRLLQCNGTSGYHLTELFTSDEPIPSYAILSHTWGAELDEVTFDDLTNGTGTDKPGYEKIRFCAEQARQDGLDYFWIDTCCINGANKAELSQTINSMFRWYRNAARCYVYLSDVSTAKRDMNGDTCEWEPTFRSSRWFTRGWTLQELLAPSSVEFFSQQHKRLGDKCSLRQQIHEITAIPEAALQGEPLSQFSVNDRLSWIEYRETKLEEDKVYSLLGIFDVFIPPIYNVGVGRAFQRLLDEIGKLEKCTQDLHITDPRRDKARIEKTKGGLLEDSYYWILENPDFQRWRDNSQSRLLWIKGDPGKGKTMLLCGIINELSKSIAKTALLSYFFCQATDSRINNATAVLRGLIYLLVNQQPSLVSHIRKKHDQTGKALFEDANAWVALSEIFTDIVQDPSLKSIYLIIDALDECVIDLKKLLDFIVQTSSTASRVKWIISSRNLPDVEERLERAGDKVRLSLELNADSVSAAVRSYIRHRVSQTAQDKKYSDQTKHTVLDYLYTNANNTFLWAALVCQNMDKMSRFNIVTKLKAFPPGLNSLYKRMIQRINDSDDADLCRRILAIVTIVYRPITLQELTSLVEELNGMAEDLDLVREVVNLCGSLLTIRDGIVYFVHQSAKDFLLTEAFHVIFPSGSETVHYTVFFRSLLTMSNTLQRDMKKFLYWLEALSLCKSIPQGVIAITRLETAVEGRIDTQTLAMLTLEGHGVYVYSVAFSHDSAWLVSGSWDRTFKIWDTSNGECLQTLEGHGARVNSVAFSHDSAWLASGSYDCTVKIWDASSGECLQTLEGYSDSVNSVAFSHDSARLASGSYDRTVKIWDASSGECLQTLEGHSDSVNSVAFSHDSARLASGCNKFNES
ncbi:WD40 repeat-like protein [Lojkania enalia]|uniref:WD40 repeat-like protein n=1 Tax=Lojkania enalia TaxID=147567 RepID=A0A9P4K8N3_9PLEO|nr:WD40 repeat-like protein [Didymosphaeria enalia]